MLLYKKIQSFNLYLILSFVLALNIAKAQDSFGQLNGPDGGEIKILTVGASDAIYAGTWGNGMMRSLNSGTSWTVINTGLTNMYITDIKYTSQSLLFATTWGGGIFKSNDNGGTWTEQNNGLTNLKVKCLLVKTKDTLFAGTFGDGIFRSTDAGVSWKPSSFGLTYQDVNCLTVTRGGAIVIGTYGGGIFLSTNNGDSWKNNNGGVGSKFINTFYYRKDSVTVVATNGKGLYITDNDAKSWYEFQDAFDSKIEDQNITCFTTLTLKGINEFIVGTRSKGVYYYTSVSYDQFRTSSIISGGVNAIVKLSNNDLIVAIPRRGIYKSTDGGVIWTYVSQGFNQVKDIYKLFKPKGSLMFASAKDGGLFRSIDNGSTWSLSGFAGQKIQDLIITSSNKVLVEINKNPQDAMWSSLDSGATWFVNPGAADTVLSLLELSNNDIIAYYFRQPAVTPPTQPDPRIRMKRSTDGGATFAEILPSPNIKGQDAKFIQRSNGNIFGYITNIGVPSLYKSINNGTSYTILNGFSATVTAKDIKSSPDNTLYFGTSNGLYKSTNDGLTWPLDIMGFVSPNTSANPFVNNLAIRSNSELYVATDNADGFYKTADTGQNWDSLNSSFTVADVQSVVLNSDNDVYISTSSLYKMVNPTSMGVPLLNVPIDMKTNVDLRPSFTWTASKKAELYELEISQSDNFDYANIFFTQAPTELTVFDSLLYNTKYYWKVRGKSFGSYSDWSTSREFTTKLAPPLLASPINGKRGVRVLPKLYWHPVEGSSSYTVQISNSNSFTNIAFTETVANDTTLIDSTIELSALTNYWWRVRASSSISTSDWSNSWQFRTTVDRPKLRYPNKGSKTEDIDLISKWDTVKEATDYLIEVSKSNDFLQIIYSSKTSDLDNQNLKNLEFNTTYYWHVRGKNDEGTGEWSEDWDFKTGVQPPILVAPDSGKTNMPTTVIFRWSTSKNATSYHLQVSEKADFTSLHFDSSTLTDVQQEVKGLSKYTTYYWRVLTKVGSFESPYGNVWNIKTLMDTTKLFAPLNKKQDVAQSVYLEWLPTKGAISYELQVSRNETYTNIMYDNTNVKETKQNIVFPPDSTFYWRVKAKSLEGNNEWSEQWSFKTTINSVEDDLASNSFVFYPNPFDENLTIHFSLIKDAKVQIKVIDVSGREIAILKDSYDLSGEQKLEWKPIGISKGIYYLHVKIGESISLREVRFGK